MTVDEIRAVITAEIGGLTREMKRAADAVGALRKESVRSFGQMTTSMKATESGLASFGRAFKTAISLELIRRAASEFRELSDASANLNARLLTATGGGEAFATAQREVVRIAQESRQSIQAVGESYARFATATKDLGASAEVVGRAIETLNKAVVVSGATSIEAVNAIRQLSQGLASGRLQGEELRAALEQLPIVVRLISKETGIAFGQIREAAAKGLIGPKEILAALVHGAEEIDTAFAKFPVTIEQAMTLVSNEMFLLVQQLNEGTSASNDIAAAIQDFGRFLRENRTEIIEFASTLVSAFGEAFKFVAGVVAGAQMAISDFLATRELSARGFQSFEEVEVRIADLRTTIMETRDALAQLSSLPVDLQAGVGIQETKQTIIDMEKEIVDLTRLLDQAASGSMKPLGVAASQAGAGVKQLDLNLRGSAEGAGLSDKALKALNKEIQGSIKLIAEMVKAQDAAAKSASDFLGGLQRDALNLTPAQAKLADLSEEIKKLTDLPPDAMVEFAGGIMRAADAAELLRTQGVSAIVDIGKAAESTEEKVSNAASGIGDAFKTAFEGIALGTRELEDIPGLFKDAFAKAFFDTLYEKSGFDKLFKGNIFDLIQTVGGFLTGPGGFTEFFSTAFSAVLGDKKGFDQAFGGAGGGSGGAGGLGAAGYAAGAATLLGGAAGGLGGAYLGGKLGGAVGGKTGALVGNLGGGLLGAKVGANLVAGIVAYLNGTSSLGLIATALQSTLGTAATTALANAGIISLGTSTAATTGGAVGGTVAPAASGLSSTGIGAIVAAAVLGAIQTASSVQRALGGDVQGGATQNALDPLGILGFAGVDIAAELGLANTKTKGEEFRQGIEGFAEGLFTDFDLLFSRFDEAEARFPDLFKSALPSVRALATTIAEVGESSLGTQDEVSQLVNVVVNSMGEVGLASEQVLNVTSAAFDKLGISAAEAGLLAQDAMAAGRISTEEFTQTILGLAEISGITFEEMQLQIETLGESFIDTAERMGLAMAELGISFIEEGVLNVQALELQLRAAFAAGQIGAADVAKGLADIQAGVLVATELLGVNGVEAFGLLRDAGITSMEDLRNASISDLANIISAIDKLGVDGATFLRVLRDNGIASFADLASASQEQINNIISALGGIPTEIHTDHVITTTEVGGGGGLPPGSEGTGLNPGGGGVSTAPPGYQVPGAQIGGFVSQSGLAVIHRGEEVVTAELVKKLDSFARGVTSASRRGAAGQIIVVPVVDRNDLPSALQRLKREKRLPVETERGVVLGQRVR